MKAVLAFLLLVPLTVNALMLQFSWAAPTHREDGDVLNPDDIVKYDIFDAADGQLVTSVDAPALTTNYDIPNTFTGSFTIQVTDRYGLKSRMSEPVAFNIAPPQGTTITIIIVLPPS